MRFEIALRTSSLRGIHVDFGPQQTTIERFDNACEIRQDPRFGGHALHPMTSGVGLIAGEGG